MMPPQQGVLTILKVTMMMMMMTPMSGEGDNRPECDDNALDWNSLRTMLLWVCFSLAPFQFSNFVVMTMILKK